MRVLIIEDEIKIASFMKNGLKQERYEVDLETNGRDGLELAMNTQYDLILLDVMLPGINGIEILKELRANNYNVPVILISALDSTEDRVNGLDFGADDYISTSIFCRIPTPFLPLKGKLDSYTYDSGDIYSFRIGAVL